MHPVDPDQVTIHGRTLAELRSQWAADARRQRRRDAVARWEAHASVLPLDVWLTVPELARLWWPDAYAGSPRSTVPARHRAEMRARKRLGCLAAVGLLEVDIQPHPTRRQVAYHARRGVWKDLGRWVVGEMA